MATVILYAFLTSGLWFILAPARIFRGLKQRLPGAVLRFMFCAACFGFWLGSAAHASLGWYLGLSPFGLLPPHAWYTVPAVGVCSVVWTPIISVVLVRALQDLGEMLPSAPSNDEEDHAQSS